MITLAFGATATLAACLPLPWWLRALAVLAIAAWAVHACALALRRSRRAVTVVILRADRTVTLLQRDGRAAHGRVESSSFVGARLATLVWREPGRWRRSRALPIVADMLDAEAFRQLRVLLRYGRSGEVADRPASQARASTSAALSSLGWPSSR